MQNDFSQPMPEAPAVFLFLPPEIFPSFYGSAAPGVISGVGVGSSVGSGVGVGVGSSVGSGVGVGVGSSVGSGVGVGVGSSVGSGVTVGSVPPVAGRISRFVS